MTYFPNTILKEVTFYFLLFTFYFLLFTFYFLNVSFLQFAHRVIGRPGSKSHIGE
jgi:hypothetical protein